MIYVMWRIMWCVVDF